MFYIPRQRTVPFPVNRPLSYGLSCIPCPKLSSRRNYTCRGLSLHDRVIHKMLQYCLVEYDQFEIRHPEMFFLFGVIFYLHIFLEKCRNVIICYANSRILGNCLDYKENLAVSMFWSLYISINSSVLEIFIYVFKQSSSSIPFWAAKF